MAFHKEAGFKLSMALFQTVLYVLYLYIIRKWSSPKIIGVLAH